MMKARKTPKIEIMSLERYKQVPLPDCDTCGKANFEEDMKMIIFGKNPRTSTKVCLCSSCADQLKELLSITI